ncbi:DUF2141 domain-containing protein [Lacinutrix neustonica]|uniref:DUF2141 domain-containing protein n=1 Tax=Lacinutrix neustonica TaxID=2980107 RepID=A0A9E8MYI6_9FLAO|nr:DUF2141 domain-containing protein [Lacinutrix neustonica]WAC03234.1 DUF2141 domain-containing protein [Lacinutrix neustonica]
MKTLTITFAFILPILFGFAQQNQNHDITVTIDNVKNDVGKVVLGLHTEATFMKTEAVQTAESKIENGKITITFKNVAPGTYGIMALHDENENGRMDFESNGMPAESYGMSNNPLSYGPPRYSDAEIEVKDEDLNLTIRF